MRKLPMMGYTSTGTVSGHGAPALEAATAALPGGLLELRRELFPGREAQRHHRQGNPRFLQVVRSANDDRQLPRAAARLLPAAREGGAGAVALCIYRGHAFFYCKAGSAATGASGRTPPCRSSGSGRLQGGVEPGNYWCEDQRLAWSRLLGKGHQPKVVMCGFVEWRYTSACAEVRVQTA